MAVKVAQVEADRGDEGPTVHKRRMWEIRALFKEGELNIRELAQQSNFVRAFGQVPNTTQTDDLDAIERDLNNSSRGLLVREGSKLRLIEQDQFAFEDLGYKFDAQGTTEKNRIGKYIVEHLLGDQEQLYLSTGTTAFAVCVELLRSGVKKARTVLTHNLAIVDLWNRQGGIFPENSTELVILGGKADYAFGDIDPDDEELSQLHDWHCTKAIMSCTYMDIAAGRVFSSRQPKLKKWLAESKGIGTLIIPVTREKFKKETAGGKRIRFPGNDMPKVVVTTTLTDKERESLKRAGFDPHTVE